MEAVGCVGIMKVTKHIICRNWRQFGAIALLLAIPFACDLIVVDVSSLALHAVAGFLFAFFNVIVSSKAQLPQALAPTSSFNSTDPLFPPLDLPDFALAPLLAYLLFSILLPLLSTPLLTFSVCQACLNVPLSLKSSLLRIPRCTKNLILASLCIAAVLFVCFSCVTATLGLLIAVVVMTKESMPLSIAVFGIWMALGLCGVYLAILFSLTQTVAILEEQRGWGALKRSMDLVNGRKWVAFGLACAVYAISLPCEFSVLWQWSGATILKVGLQTLAALWSTTSHVVLYVSCKRRREEPLHTLIAGSPALDQFLPQSMDTETHALLPPL